MFKQTKKKKKRRGQTLNETEIDKKSIRHRNLYRLKYGDGRLHLTKLPSKDKPAEGGESLQAATEGTSA